MRDKLTYPLIGIMIIALSLSSCVRQSTPTPSRNTRATQTAAARQEELAAYYVLYFPFIYIPPIPTPTPTVPSPTPPPPTFTPGLPTATLIPLPPTPIPPSPTALCNKASFIQDINYPDGSVFEPGTKFTKIWRVQNTGSCPWDRKYSLMFVTGDLIGAAERVALPGVVQPGQMVDLMLPLVAPAKDGRYVGGWMIYNGVGSLFGVGVDGLNNLWVDITVHKQVTATAKPTGTATPKPTTAPSATSVPPTTAVPATTAAPSATVPSPTVTPSPTPVTPSPTPVTPSPTPVTPSPTPVTPNPTDTATP